MVQGRFFNENDFEQYQPVAVIDEQLAAILFSDQTPIRQTIFAGGNRLTVIGVAQTKTLGDDPQNEGSLWLTENYVNSIQGKFQFTSFQISPYHLEEIEQVKVSKVSVEQVLQQRYPQATIYLSDNVEDLLREKETQQLAAQALTGVGIIALIISGVGIANITFASAIERTKEVGIRRAIGATQLEIMMQFVLEAVVLSLLGGAVAVITVHGLTQFITKNFIQEPYQFSYENTAKSMGAAVTVGVLSSFFPAVRATKIDVVEALRSE